MKTPNGPTAGPPAVPALPSGARQQEEQTASRAASAASPDAERIAKALVVAVAHGDRDPEEVLAAALRAYGDAAYARGLAERDARWREAVRAVLGEGAYAALMAPEHALPKATAAREAQLRALLGSAATAPTAPPSPSGALAGAEEMTEKDTQNTQRAATRGPTNTEER